jgi:hypothetical protein
VTVAALFQTARNNGLPVLSWMKSVFRFSADCILQCLVWSARVCLRPVSAFPKHPEGANKQLSLKNARESVTVGILK